jgi:hypothetical protein
MDLEDLYRDGSCNGFLPPHCPRDGCASRSGGSAFAWQRKGRYRRWCDGRIVQRFFCRTCRRYFSTQTFRLDYRLQLPEIHYDVFDTFVSKVTQRQAARNLSCTRKTVVHRLRLLAQHSRDFHTRALQRVSARGGLEGKFQLDELETFENSRRLAPLTVPILAERVSYFVVDMKVAPLPPRGNLRPAERERKHEREKDDGPRRSGSRAAVKACFQTLAEVCKPFSTILISTDFKSTYPGILREVMTQPYVHTQHISTAVRDYYNPLFPINHTLAMMRDGVSRLVRRSWGASKLRGWLELHLWVWIAYRNYIRGVTNRAWFTTPAQALGVMARRFDKRALFQWRIFSTP